MNCHKRKADLASNMEKSHLCSKNMRSKKTEFNMLQSSSILVHQGELHLSDFKSVSVLTKSLVVLFEESQFIENMKNLQDEVTSNATQYSSIYRVFLEKVLLTITKC